MADNWAACTAIAALDGYKLTLDPSPFSVADPQVGGTTGR
jgi:hypothetical protein